MRIRLPRLSLLQTFGAVSLLVIMAMGATLGTLLHNRIERRALQDTQRLAVTIAHVGIAGQLRDGEPDNGPLSKDRIAALDGWFASSGLLRGKLYATAGTSPGPTTTSSSGGRVAPRRCPRGARRRGRRARRGRRRGARRRGPLFEVYVPIRRGVFESYMPYEPTARAIARTPARWSSCSS